MVEQKILKNKIKKHACNYYNYIMHALTYILKISHNTKISSDIPAILANKEFYNLKLINLGEVKLT